MSTIKVKVPASTANLGPGYDIFGIALKLYNSITIEDSDSLAITTSGPYTDSTIPLDSSNLVAQSIQKFYNRISKPCPAFKINIDCQIPLSSGLGSSSTAIAGGVAAANKFENDPLTLDELVTLAWQIEGHPDNTTPALLGGFVMSTIIDDTKIAYNKIPWPEHWQIIIAHPKFPLSTQKAREILPKSVSMADAIFNMGRCSFLVSAVCQQNPNTLKMSLKDKLHQPYRATLVPGLEDIFKTLEQSNVIGTVLSGAGPSICIINIDEPVDNVKSIITDIWAAQNIQCEFFMPEVENRGIVFVND